MLSPTISFLRIEMVVWLYKEVRTWHTILKGISSGFLRKRIETFSWKTHGSMHQPLEGIVLGELKERLHPGGRGLGLI